ncbi:hypothetical protein P4H65_24155 [Paenibacillus chitinolyticus]|uniref:hypothetical protein n=1 Tax=Paenibacillus chitinolyticus TaxID=79263 RepID=UPI002DB7BEC1|nr:hypothetical protein [Paenibacillus chitinolyticus]MEC0248890.1 hypothetical protein [Paenibacillus chitinolyticus]
MADMQLEGMDQLLNRLQLIGRKSRPQMSFLFDKIDSFAENEYIRPCFIWVW